MQSSSHIQYIWIMVYQCHLTKFYILRPLTSKRTSGSSPQPHSAVLPVGRLNKLFISFEDEDRPRDRHVINMYSIADISFKKTSQ